MPWDCGCGRSNLDSLQKCGGCGNLKTSWTLQLDKTRQIVLKTGPRLKVETGVAYAGSFDHAGVPATQKTRFVPVMDKAFVNLFALTGELPPSGHLLVVSDPPRKKRKKKLKLTIEYERKEMEELDLFAPPKQDGDDGESEAAPPAEGEPRVAVFLFVYGPTPDLEGVEFPGIRMIDISEDTFLGFAPQVKVGKRTLFTQELLPDVELHEVARAKPEAEEEG